MKFGGTSVADAKSMLMVIDIVRTNAELKPVVVLSACSGTTDSLLKLITNAACSSLEDSLDLIEEIRLRHISIAEESINNKNIREETIAKTELLVMELTRLVEGVNLLGECTAKSLDSAMAYGELLSTTIFTAICSDNAIPAVFFDARSFMKTNSDFQHAKVDISRLNECANKELRQTLDDGKIVITQGFIGSDEQNRTTTLGRGGSDYSASLIGAALSVDEIQIWTDVPGVMTADPRIVPDAFTNEFLTIDEVRELSFFGAKVLHHETIKPAMDEKIPVRVLNTKDKNNEGTTILHKCAFDNPRVRTIVLKENVMILSQFLSHTENSYVVLSQIIEELNRNEVKLYTASATTAKLSIIIDSIEEDNIQDENMLNKYHFERKSLICICGVNFSRGGAATSEIISLISNTLSRFSYSSFLFGINTNSILVSIDTIDAKDAILDLHKSLFVKNE